MRSHLYRLVQDIDGSLLGDIQVAVYQAESGILLSEDLYTDSTGTDTLTNPYTSNGVLDFYLEVPRRIRIGITPPGGTERFLENIDVQPDGDFLQNVDALIYGPDPLALPDRDTATKDPDRRVRWVTPTPPSTAPGKALATDVWEPSQGLPQATLELIEQHNLKAMRAFNLAVANTQTSTSPTPVDVWHCGDSITEGWSGTTSDENAMTPTVLRKGLAHLFNPKGRYGRWIPAGGNWYPSQKFSANGTAIESNQGISLRNRRMAAGDAPATVSVTCDRILVYYRLRNVFASANIVIKIDGSTVLDTLTYKNTGTYCSTAFGHEVVVYDSGPLARASHTLSVEQKTNGAYNADISWDGAYFFDGDYSSGVRYWNASHFGYNYGTYNANNEASGPNQGWLSVLRQGLIRPALIIGSHGVNETNATTLEANLRQWIDDVWSEYDAQLVPRCSIALEVPYATHVRTKDEWDTMRRVIYRVGFELGCAIWDWNELTGNVSSATGDPFGLTSDNIHLNSAGQRMRGLWLTSKVVSHMPLSWALGLLRDEIGLGGGGGGAGTVTSVNGIVPDVGGNVTLVKGNLGLDQVENTSDNSKPVSAATQAALNAKAPIAVTDMPTMFATVGGWPMGRAAFLAAVGGGYSGPIRYDKVLYPAVADPTDQQYGDRLRDRI